MAFDLSKLTSLLHGDISTPTKRSVVGVDIGTSAIKVVQLYDKKGVPTLETYGELQLGPYEGSDIGRTTHLPPSKLMEAFVDILRESATSATDVALAISYSGSFTSIVPFPTSDTSKITAMMPVEAKKYVPVSLTEVTLDWFPVASTSDKKTTLVLLVAIHNDVLKRYNSVVAGAKLNMKLSEIEMFSSIRSTVTQSDKTVAVIDCGAGSTRLYIVEKGVVAKTHSVLMSGVECTNAVAQALSISFKEAEERKRTSGIRTGAGDSRIVETLTPIVERGFRELHKVMQRFEETEHEKITKVILSGNGASLIGISAYAQNMFSKPVVIADPFSKVAYPAFLEDTLKEAGPSFAVAVGVALRALLS